MERYTSCTVELNIFDTTAQSDSTLAVSNIQDFSNINSIKEESEITKVATLESDYFLLDGSYDYKDNVEDIEKHVGYFSDEFTTRIVSTFLQNHSSVGITFHFWDVYPDSISMVFYDENNVVLGRGTYTPNSLNYFCELEVDNYRKVEIEITSLERYVRLNYIDYGASLVYGDGLDKKLKTCTVTEENNAISSEIPANESKVEVIDSEKLFEITNPKSYYKYLQKRQQFKITELIDKTKQYICTHYLKEWSQENEAIATFTLQDVIGVMSDTTFYGGMYDNVTAENLFKEIFYDFGLDDDQFEIDEKIKEKTLSGLIKVGSHRDALQQVAFACGACVDTTRSEKIRIRKTLFESISFIDSDRKLLSTHKITQKDLITKVVMTAHNYQLGDADKQIYKADMTPGSYRVTFNQPSADITVTNAILEGYNCNYADIVVEDEVNVVITGKVYEDNSVEYYYQINEMPSATDENVLEVKDATLISKSNAKEIGKLLYDFKQYRLEHQAKIINVQEKVGTMYSIKTSDHYSPLLVTKMTMDLTGGYISEVEGIGYALREIDAPRTGIELYTDDNFII